MTALLAIGMMIAVMIGRSEAVTCYACTGLTASGCNDPFSSSGISTCTGEACSKSKGTVQGVTSVVRTCLPASAGGDSCNDATAGGITSEICVCNSNHCNDGQMVKPIHYKLPFAVAMATLMVVAWMNKI